MTFAGGVNVTDEAGRMWPEVLWRLSLGGGADESGIIAGNEVVNVQNSLTTQAQREVTFDGFYE
jgi:hypothetical protein